MEHKTKKEMEKIGEERALIRAHQGWHDLNQTI